MNNIYAIEVSINKNALTQNYEANKFHTFLYVIYVSHV